MAQLIGVVGPKNSGKTTVAALLSRRLSKDTRRMKMAAPIKSMVHQFLLHLGYSKPEVEEMIDGSEKSKVIPICGGVTPRTLMQTLGTEWGRDQIGDDVWVSVQFSMAKRLLRNDINVIFDDIRFENEFDAFKTADRSHHVMIGCDPGDRLDADKEDTHRSESSTGSLVERADIILDTSMSVSYLEGQIDGITLRSNGGEIKIEDYIEQEVTTS